MRRRCNQHHRTAGFSQRIAPFVSLLTLTIALSSCGGGSGQGGGATAGPPPPPHSSPQSPIAITSIEYAQTHIVPAAGLSWQLASATGTLTLVGKRETLALAALTTVDAINPFIEGKVNGASLGTVPLNAPSALPPTEAGGAPYKAGLYSAVLPAEWMVKGLSLTVDADNYAPSAASTPVIGASTKFTLNIVPFYLFGANDSNAQPLSNVQSPSAASQSDMYDKWPVSELTVMPFAGGRISLPDVVVSPRTDAAGVRQPAYLLSNMDQQRERFAAMNSALDLMRVMRRANGDEATNNLYYGPIIALNAGGQQANLGGGLGGLGGGVGDTAYDGIFIHELGHAFGLAHANDAFNAGQYPYAGGSLKGSAWGYNQRARVFLNLLVDKSANRFNNCAASHQTNDQGVCFKQDPMQGGHEDRTAGFTYGTFSDYYTGKMQEFFEGRTTTDSAGKRVYSGGVLFADPGFAGGYAQWDGIDRTFVAYQPPASESGLNSINRDLPVTRNVPVYTILLAFSHAGSAGASKIYAPISYSGNLIRTFDPYNAQDRADIVVDTGKYGSYCKRSGCDYTLRVTYGDGSVIHRVLKDGFRTSSSPTSSVPAASLDPLNRQSFKTWGINVPGGQSISKVELLDTPMVWNGMPAAPTVLLTYQPGM